MRKRLFLIWLAGMAALSLWGQQPDTARFAALDAKLEEYFTALAGEPVEVQDAECDFLISSCRDPEVRQRVALKVYDHYLRSKIMGDEGVAVHIADRWFLSGEVPMLSDLDLLNARVFAEFNRSSLIGNAAPELLLTGADGGPVRFPAEGRYCVLYFYDTSCSSCQVETVRLTRFLQGYTEPLDVLAVYTGQDEAAWSRYRSTQFEGTGVVHAWDPAMDSDYQRLYGVLQTPKMLLVDPSGVIVGRGLDTPALSLLLGQLRGEKGYTYGTDASMRLFERIFSQYAEPVSADQVLEVADHVAERTFGEGDLDTFKEMEGDLLYYLSSRRGEGIKEGTRQFIDRFILVPDVWTSAEDSVQVVSLAVLMKDLLERTPVGSAVPDLTVHGVLRRKPGLFRKGAKEGDYALRKLGASYVVFYTPGCGSCEATLVAVDRLTASDRKARVLLVDMDAMFADRPAEAARLLDTFDLSALPFVLELDKAGTILHKYVEF